MRKYFEKKGLDKKLNKDKEIINYSHDKKVKIQANQ